MERKEEYVYKKLLFHTYCSNYINNISIVKRFCSGEEEVGNHDLLIENRLFFVIERFLDVYF